MAYNVRVPFATMGQSVGRQIAEKKDRGFVANMQRLNEALAPHARQRKKQRFSEQLQEDRLTLRRSDTRTRET